MDLERYTQKAQKAILDAQQRAVDYHPSAVEPAHLLLALVRQGEGVAPAIITRIAGSPAMLVEELEKELASRPKAYGDTDRPSLARAAADGLKAAERQAASLRGHPGSHPSDPHRHPRLTAGGEPDSRDHVSGPGEIRPGSHSAGPAGKARPGDRPRRGDPPRDPGALAPHQEQSRPHRRPGRGQDGDRGRPGPADRQPRRPRRGEEEADGASSSGAPCA